MGRPRKPDDERVRRNKLPPETPPEPPVLLVEWDGYERGPDLPAGLRGIKWSVRTLAWWDTWRNSPQAMFMTPIDWEFMLETAMLHNQFWSPRTDAVTGENGKIKKQFKTRSSAELKNISTELRQRVHYMESVIRVRIKEGGKVIPPSAEDLLEEQIKLEAEEAINYVDMLNKEVVRQKEAKEE